MMMTYNNTSNAEAIETVYTYNDWLKTYKRNEEKRRAKQQEKIFQKLLGLALVLVGIIFCMIFPEDATGGAFVGALGLLRLFA